MMWNTRGSEVPFHFRQNKRLVDGYSTSNARIPATSSVMLLRLIARKPELSRHGCENRTVVGRQL
jgi:hypothetical protein